MLNSVAPYQNTLIRATEQAFIQHLLERERARVQEYISAREYYDGIHHTLLTDRMRQFLNVTRDIEFTVNYCPMVVNAKADRLIVSAFDSEDNQKETLWQWWRKNRMDRVQGIVHRAAVRDGDAFVLVEWDSVTAMPRFYFEPAFTGEGVMVYYSEERRDDIEYASKTWQIKYGSQTGKITRKNLYFPDRIEKYIAHNDVSLGTWRPYEDDTTTPGMGRLGMAGINWWTDTGQEDGNPLGIPIVHFKHNDTGDCYGTSHLASVIPLQDAVNKAMIDLLAALDSNGTGILVGYGSNEWTTLKVGPGAIAAVSQPPTTAKLERLSGESPDGLLNGYNALVMEIGRVSGTPLSYFQASGQVASSETLKQQEVALVSQVKKSQVDFGNSWEDVLTIARRLHNAFGTGAAMDDGALIDTIWKEAETRNDKEQAETLAIRVEKLGVSQEQAQTEMGYNASERAAFARDALRRQALTLRRTIQLPQQASATTQATQNLTQTENEGMDEPTRTPAA